MNEIKTPGSYEQSLYPALEYLGDASAYLDDILEFVQHIPLLDSFDKSEIESLSRYMQCFGAPGGIELLHEGDLGEYLILILTGELVIQKRDPSTGESKRFAVAGPGATLGEMSLVDREPRSASCITVSPSDFAVLTRQSLDAVAQNHPALGHRLMLVLMQLLSRRLRKTNTDYLPHAKGTGIL